MTPGSVAAMISINFRKGWKYFENSPAIVSSQKRLSGAFPDAPGPIRLHPEMKQTKALIISALKLEFISNMKGGCA